MRFLAPVYACPVVFNLKYLLRRQNNCTHRNTKVISVLIIVVEKAFPKYSSHIEISLLIFLEISCKLHRIKVRINCSHYRHFISSGGSDGLSTTRELHSPGICSPLIKCALLYCYCINNAPPKNGK